MHFRRIALTVAAASLSAWPCFSQTDFAYQPYQPPISRYAFNVSATNAHTADFNGDGLADVLVSSITSNTSSGLYLYLNNGSDGLNSPGKLPVTLALNSGSELMIADFNGDGHLDIAVLNGSNTVLLLFGNGDGTFSSPTTIQLPAGNSYKTLVEADFDGNNTQDLAAFDQNGNLTLLFNNSKGQFTQQNVKLDTPPSGFVTSNLVVGDFNGDGRPDLAWAEQNNANEAASTVWSAVNTSAGVFSPKHQVGNLPVGFPNLRSADLDLDGKSDLVTWETHPTSGGSANAITLFYSNGDSTFTGSLLDYFSPYDIGVTDINGDGVPDVVLTGYQGVTVYLGKGNRSFDGQGTFSLSYGGDQMGLGFYDKTNRVGLTTAGATADYYGRGTLYEVLNNNSQLNCPYPSSPAVSFCSATQNGGQVRVRGTARAQTQPVRQIEVWANGKKLYQVLSDEFDATLTLPAGTQITAVEVEANGATRSATTSTTQTGTCAAPSSPGVHVCSPTAGQTVSSPVNVVASGTGASGSVNHLELWVDGNKVGNYSGSMMNANVTLSSGSHAATVIEVDSKGAYVKSMPVTFTVGQSGTCAAPSSPGVHVCAPAAGQTVNSPVNVVASGTGASGSVNHLELWVNGTKIGNYSGSTMNVSIAFSSGSHTATVIEVDSKGGYVDSIPVTFTAR